MSMEPILSLPPELSLTRNRDIAALQSRLGPGQTVGSQFEQVLLHKVVEAMRTTVPDSGLYSQKAGGQIFDHLIAQAMSEAMAKGSGIGIGAMINQHFGTHPIEGTEAQTDPGKNWRKMTPIDPLRERLPVGAPMDVPRVNEGIDLADQLPPVEDRWLDSPRAEQVLRDFLRGER